jgi:hypothetical protein
VEKKDLQPEKDLLNEVGTLSFKKVKQYLEYELALRQDVADHIMKKVASGALSTSADVLRAVEQWTKGPIGCPTGEAGPVGSASVASTGKKMTGPWRDLEPNSYDFPSLLRQPLNTRINGETRFNPARGPQGKYEMWRNGVWEDLKQTPLRSEPSKPRVICLSGGPNWYDMKATVDGKLLDGVTKVTVNIDANQRYATATIETTVEMDQLKVEEAPKDLSTEQCKAVHEYWKKRMQALQVEEIAKSVAEHFCSTKEFEGVFSDNELKPESD